MALRIRLASRVSLKARNSQARPSRADYCLLRVACIKLELAKSKRNICDTHARAERREDCARLGEVGACRGKVADRRAGGSQAGEYERESFTRSSPAYVRQRLAQQRLSLCVTPESAQPVRREHLGAADAEVVAELAVEPSAASLLVQFARSSPRRAMPHTASIS